MAQERIAIGHTITGDTAEVLNVPVESGEKSGSPEETLPPTGVAGSGITTRICGAPHCRQNGLPSSTSWPHL
ncbi:MAG: hypothetical protein ABR874_02020 [Candidatus Sulfotelmatobacter sp.]